MGDAAGNEEQSGVVIGRPPRPLHGILAALEREPGRGAAVTIGTALTFAATTGLWMDRLSDWVGVSLALVGIVLAGLGALGGAIEELWFTRDGGGVRTRDPNQMARGIEEGVAIIEASSHDPEDVELPGHRIDGVRYLVGLTAIEALLHDLGGALEDCEARIFLLDAQTERLTQALSPPGIDPAIGFSWAIGQGVTGRAYATGDYVLATGTSVYDGTFGVPVGERDRYRSLTAVAAAPLRSTAGAIIGVLSISSENESTRLATDPGKAEHLVLAECVAFALDELMGLDPDVE